MWVTQGLNGKPQLRRPGNSIENVWSYLLMGKSCRLVRTEPTVSSMFQRTPTSLCIHIHSAHKHIVEDWNWMHTTASRLYSPKFCCWKIEKKKKKKFSRFFSFFVPFWNIDSSLVYPLHHSGCLDIQNLLPFLFDSIHLDRPLHTKCQVIGERRELVN